MPKLRLVALILVGATVASAVGLLAVGAASYSRIGGVDPVAWEFPAFALGVFILPACSLAAWFTTVAARRFSPGAGLHAALWLIAACTAIWLVADAYMCR